MNRLMTAVVGAVILYGVSEILTVGKNRKIRNLETRVAVLETINSVQEKLIEVLGMDEETSEEA